MFLLFLDTLNEVTQRLDTLNEDTLNEVTQAATYVVAAWVESITRSSSAYFEDVKLIVIVNRVLHVSKY